MHHDNVTESKNPVCYTKDLSADCTVFNRWFYAGISLRLLCGITGFYPSVCLCMYFGRYTNEQIATWLSRQPFTVWQRNRVMHSWWRRMNLRKRSEAYMQYEPLISWKENIQRRLFKEKNCQNGKIAEHSAKNVRPINTKIILKP